MPKHNECGRNRNPLLLAEELCVPCAGTTISAAQKKSVTPRVWSHVEWVIATHRPSRMETAAELISRAPKQSMSTQARTKLMLLEANMPAFRDRATQQPLSEQSRRQTNALLGEVLMHGLSAGDRSSTNGLIFEALSMYLMSREGVDTEYFLHPGSLREETSSTPRLNHDAYMLWPKATSVAKYPFSLKATKANPGAYDIPSLSIADSLKPAMEAMGSASLSDVAFMAAFEAAGKSNSYQETVLDFAGHCLQTALVNTIYAQQIKATPDIL